jgi:hypothetical protein
MRSKSTSRSSVAFSAFVE